MTGRTNVKNGIALNANLTNKKVATGNSIVAGDFVQYYTVSSSLGLSPDKIIKLSSQYYVALQKTDGLRLIKKTGDSFEIVDTYLLTVIEDICADADTSNMFYTVSYASSSDIDDIVKVFKIVSDEIVLMGEFTASGGTHLLSQHRNNAIFHLGEYGNHSSVLILARYREDLSASTSSNAYTMRTFYKTNSSPSDYSYTFWNEYDMGDDLSCLRYIGGFKRIGTYFYVTGLRRSGNNTSTPCINKMYLSAAGAPVIDRSKIENITVKPYYSTNPTGVPYLMNDKIVYTGNNNQSTTSIIIVDPDTLNTTVYTDPNNSADKGIQNTFGNKIIAHKRIYEVNTDTAVVTKLFNGDCIVYSRAWVTEDGYILSLPNVFQLANGATEIRNIEDVDYVIPWSTPGNPIGVANDTGAAGDTIGVYIPTSVS